MRVFMSKLDLPVDCRPCYVVRTPEWTTLAVDQSALPADIADFTRRFLTVEERDQIRAAYGMLPVAAGDLLPAWAAMHDSVIPWSLMTLAEQERQGCAWTRALGITA